MNKRRYSNRRRKNILRVFILLMTKMCIRDRDIYEETDVGYERKLSDIRANIEMLEQQMEDELSLIHI